MKKKTNPQIKQDKIEFLYDVTSIKGKKQSEAVLIAVVETFEEHLQKNRMTVTSTEQHGMTCITVLLSSSLKFQYIKDICEAINVAAYYSIHPQAVGRYFVEYAEATGNIKS